MGTNSTPRESGARGRSWKTDPVSALWLSLLSRPWRGEGAEAGPIALVFIRSSEAAGLVVVVGCCLPRSWATLTGGSPVHPDFPGLEGYSLRPQAPPVPLGSPCLQEAWDKVGVNRGAEMKKPELEGAAGRIWQDTSEESSPGHAEL